MSKTKYSKAVNQMNGGTVLVLFASVGLLIFDRFAEGTFSTILMVLGFVGLIAFLYMVFKAGRMMEKEDLARAEALELQHSTPRYSGSITRDLLNRSSLEDEQRYHL